MPTLRTTRIRLAPHFIGFYEVFRERRAQISMCRVETGLHFIWRYNEITPRLRNCYSANTNATEESGDTLPHRESKSDNQRITGQLLDRGVDIHARDGKTIHSRTDRHQSIKMTSKSCGRIEQIMQGMADNDNSAVEWKIRR